MFLKNNKVEEKSKVMPWICCMLIAKKTDELKFTDQILPGLKVSKPYINEKRSKKRYVFPTSLPDNINKETREALYRHFE